MNDNVIPLSEQDIPYYMADYDQLLHAISQVC